MCKRYVSYLLFLCIIISITPNANGEESLISPQVVAQVLKSDDTAIEVRKATEKFCSLESTLEISEIHAGWALAQQCRHTGSFLLYEKAIRRVVTQLLELNVREEREEELLRRCWGELALVRYNVGDYLAAMDCATLSNSDKLFSSMLYSCIARGLDPVDYGKSMEDVYEHLRKTRAIDQSRLIAYLRIREKLSRDNDPVPILSSEVSIEDISLGLWATFESGEKTYIAPRNVILVYYLSGNYDAAIELSRASFMRGLGYDALADGLLLVSALVKEQKLLAATELLRSIQESSSHVHPDIDVPALLEYGVKTEINREIDGNSGER